MKDNTSNGLFLLSLYELTNSYKIADFRHYISEQVNLQRNLVADLQIRYDKRVLENPEAADDIHEFFEDEKMRYSDAYPMIMRNSIYFSLYSFLELEMKSYTQALYEEKIHAKHPNPGDRLNDLQSYVGWLKKTYELNFKDLKKDWKTLNEHREIRNKLIHDDGSFINSDQKNPNFQEKINPKSQTLYPILAKYPGLKISEHYNTFHIAEDEFLFDFLDVIERFLNGIVKEVRLQQAKI